MSDFPLPVDEPVYFCGFTSRKFYPGNSYLIRHAEGNWLVDALRAEDYCWYSWEKQAESIRRLTDFTFEWVLPGHGQRVYLPVTEMRTEVLRLADEIKSGLG